jgi:hypothetical protein
MVFVVDLAGSKREERLVIGLASIPDAMFHP